MARRVLPERVEAQRQKVLQKAAELFVKKGFHATSVDDIAKGLNLTKGTVYYYVPSKDQLLFQVQDLAHQLHIDALTEIMQGDEPAEVKLRQAIMKHIQIGVSEMSAVVAIVNLEFFLVGRSRAKIVKKRSKYDMMFRQLIQDGIDQGLFIQCDPAMVTFYILGFCNYIPRWYKETGRLSKDQIAEMYADLALRSLLVHPPERLESSELPVVQFTEIPELALVGQSVFLQTAPKATVTRKHAKRSSEDVEQPSEVLSDASEAVNSGA